MVQCMRLVVILFFNDTATTETYTYGHTLSLHDALPICFWPIHARRTYASGKPRPSKPCTSSGAASRPHGRPPPGPRQGADAPRRRDRSEEHTSELQSLMRISYAVFCLKKKTKHTQHHTEITYNNIYQN